jgi:hypothetical protein
MGITSVKGSGYRRQGCLAYPSVSPVTFTSGTVYTVNINTGTAGFNDDNMLDAVNHKIIIPVAGRYRLCGQVTWPQNATNYRAGYMRVVSADYGTYSVSEIKPGVATHQVGMTADSIANLKKDDTVELQVYQNSGSNLSASGLSLGVQEIG